MTIHTILWFCFKKLSCKNGITVLLILQVRYFKAKFITSKKELQRKNIWKPRDTYHEIENFTRRYFGLLYYEVVYYKRLTINNYMCFKVHVDWERTSKKRIFVVSNDMMGFHIPPNGMSWLWTRLQWSVKFVVKCNS